MVKVWGVALSIEAVYRKLSRKEVASSKVRFRSQVGEPWVMKS